MEFSEERENNSDESIFYFFPVAWIYKGGGGVQRFKNFVHFYINFYFLLSSLP